MTVKHNNENYISVSVLLGAELLNSQFIYIYNMLMKLSAMTEIQYNNNNIFQSLCCSAPFSP